MSADIRPQRVTFIPLAKEMSFYTHASGVVLPELAFPIFKLITNHQEQGLTTIEIVEQIQHSDYSNRESDSLDAIDGLFVHGFIQKLITYADGAEPATSQITYQDMIA